MRNLKRIFTVCIAIAMVMALAGPALAEEAGKININTASVEELTRLKRVGTSYAERIVKHREKEPFKSPEDIMKVQGIGAKTFEVNKDRIVVE
jgi:competence protein ComEA